MLARAPDYAARKLTGSADDATITGIVKADAFGAFPMTGTRKG